VKGGKAQGVAIERKNPNHLIIFMYTKSATFKKRKMVQLCFYNFCALGTAAESKAFINYYCFNFREKHFDET
jgi:hypothetical protein